MRNFITLCFLFVFSITACVQNAVKMIDSLDKTVKGEKCFT
jgi:hypothetical protein